MSNIIQTKLAAGTLKGWWDFRSGTPDDLSGNGHDATFNGVPAFNRAALNFGGLVDYLTIDNSSGDLDINDTLTAFVLCNPRKLKDEGLIETQWTGVNATFRMTRTAAGLFTLSLYNGASSVTVTTAAFPSKDGLYAVCAVYDKDAGANNLKLYVDGVVAAQGTQTGSGNGVKRNYEIGRTNANNTYCYDGGIACALLFDEALNITEIGNIMGETRAQRWPTKPMGRAYSKGLSGVPGLLKAWMMQPQGATVPEAVSGVGNGTIEGNLIHSKTPVGDALRFCGNNERIACGVGQLLPAAAFSTAILCQPLTRGEGNFGRFFEAGVSTYAAYIASATTGNLRYAGSGGGTNLGFTGLLLGQWTLLLVTYDGTTINIYSNGELVGSAVDTVTLDAAQPLFIGNPNTGNRAFDGPIAYLQHFDHALTEVERTRLYEHSLSAIQFRTDWGTPVTVPASVGAGAQLGPFMVDSGTFKLTTDTIEGRRVKAIKCVTDGVVYVDMLQWMTPSEEAYGTWEVYVYKANTADDMDLVFIADTIGGLEAAGQNGYGFRYKNTDDGIYLYASAAGALTWMGHFIGLTPAGSWYLLHLDRTGAGLFSMWVIDDSAVGSASDTTTTTGRYMAIEMDAGDKVALADVGGGHSIIKRLGVV